MARKNSLHKRTEVDTPEVFNISKESGSFRFSRRDFVKIASATSVAAWLAGCAPVQTESGVGVDVIRTPTAQVLDPTSTRLPENTPTATAVMFYGSISSQGINVRTGPSTDYLAIGSLAAGVTVMIVGKNEDGTWLNVLVKVADLPNLAGTPITKNGTVAEIEGWIRTDLVSIFEGSLDILPIKAAPPIPTPLPNQKPSGSEGITYKFTDPYGYTSTYTLPCGSPIPQGAVCVCNCVAVCSCDGYSAPPVPTSCSCDSYGTICTCDVVSYWYPN
jgi:hypothetical protein